MQDPTEKIPSTNAAGTIVIRVIARLNVGGPALHALHLSVGLADRYRTILATGKVEEDEADMSEEVIRKGVNVQRVAGLGRTIRPLDDLRALWHLFRLFRCVRPQIVHTHTAKAGTLGRIAAIVARVPVVVHTFHGHVFHGYFDRFSTRVFITIERLLGRFTTKIIAISETQAEDLSERYRICERDRIEVVPLGLELDRFAPERIQPLRDGFREEIAVHGDQPVVTIVGRLVPIKNHDLLLLAAAELERRGRRCTYVIVGGGSEEAWLKQRADELNLASVVRFLGWRDDIDRVYAGSDIVALTSNNEGTPVCLIEALAAGRPVVATDVGGVRDVLEQGQLGELVPPGDAIGLANAVERLIDDPARSRQMARAGAMASPRRFGVERLIRDVSKLYHDLRVAPTTGERSAPPGAK